MAWKTPKTDWAANDVLGPNDFNRIEGNTLDNHEKLNGHLSDGTQHAKTARFVVGTSTAGWTKKDCDYLCDGTADQVEINNAINALPASGGEIVILDGTYNITAKINVNKDNVSIKGNGNATILKRMWNSSSSEEGVITLTSVEGCRVENLQIDGNKTTYTSYYNYAICLNSSNNNTVTGNTCNNNEHSGIHLYSSNNNTITGNTCNNNSKRGIPLDSSNNNTITGNTCNNNEQGIFLDSSSNNTITGNTCDNNSNGIYLYSSSNNNTVTGNTCGNNDRSGIRLFSSSNNMVTGNICNNNINGIFLDSSNNNAITGNTFNNNDNSGIHLYSSSNNNVITGNTCICGTGTPEDYTANQHTIFLSGAGNNYNLISSNNCMGKVPVVQGGIGNTVFNNKWDASDDIASINSTLSSHNSRISSNTNRLDNIEDGTRLALGRDASATGDYSVALGFDTWAGPRSVALGRSASAAGQYSVALGHNTSATGNYSVALGSGASAENNSEGKLGLSTSTWKVPGSFTVNGTKQFEIPHPKPEKKATHVIRHSAVESPTPGDTLYRWKVQATKDNDIVTVDLPDYFVWLNKDVQIFITPQGHFGNGYGELNRETEQLEIHCQLAGEYNVLVIGTRNDDHESVQNWSIKGVEREIGESWTGETYVFSVNEIIEMEEIKEVSA